MNVMPARKIIFAIAIALCSIPLLLSAGIANADDLDIDTGDVEMSLGQNGVFIRTAPVYPVPTNGNFNGNFNRNLNGNWNRRIGNSRANRVLKCRNVSQRRHSRRGSTQVYSSATTTVCN
jgi:hypothetical protein